MDAIQAQLEQIPAEPRFGMVKKCLDNQSYSPFLRVLLSWVSFPFAVMTWGAATYMAFLASFGRTFPTTECTCHSQQDLFPLHTIRIDCTHNNLSTSNSIACPFLGAYPSSISHHQPNIFSKKVSSVSGWFGFADALTYRASLSRALSRIY